MREPLGSAAVVLQLHGFAAVRTVDGSSDSLFMFSRGGERGRILRKRREIDSGGGGGLGAMKLVCVYLFIHTTFALYINHMRAHWIPNRISAHHL